MKKLTKNIITAYADETMDIELCKFETTESRIPHIVEEVESKTNQWQHILITFAKRSDGYIGFSRYQWA